MAWAGLAFGILLFLTTWASVLATLVLPGRSSRLAAAVGQAVRALFLVISDRRRGYEAKDRLLAWQGPITLVVVVSTWLLLFFLSFALILWPLTGGSFIQALTESGSSMLTLGFAATSGAAPAAVHFVAAATGLIMVALQIAYLPALYGSFNRRETLVTMLQSRAGSPAWGPEILARHQLVGITDNLPDFYGDWEQWAADVAESHANYPVLIAFRSPQPLRSWLVALLAVLDSAALYHALSPQAAPSQARLCIRMGFTALRDIARVVKIPFDPDPRPGDPVALTYEEFLEGVARLDESGFPMERTPEEAWPHFRGWRVNYEGLVYDMADWVGAVPGPWSGPRRHVPGETILPQRVVDRRPGDPEGVGRGRSGS